MKKQKYYNTINRIMLATMLAFFGALSTPFFIVPKTTETLTSLETLGILFLSIIIGILTGMLGYLIGLVLDIDDKNRNK